MLFHVAQRGFGLAHGALSHNLATEKKVETLGAHPLACQAKHQRMTVHAGIHVAPVAGGRVAQHFEISWGDLPDDQWNAGLPGRGTGLDGREERRLEGDPGHLDGLLPQNQAGKDAVQTPGAESQGPDGFFFGCSHVR